MAMTITEKIFAAHCGEKEVHAGQLIDAEVDIMMCHDVTTPPAISMIKQAGIKPIHDPDRIVATPDHFQPAKDIKSAELLKRFDSWCKEHKIKNYYPVGKAGVCHALLPEQGHIRPGDVIVGGDSHTCTYGALGAFSTGVGSTDLAAAIATGKLWFRVPESMKIVLKGSLSKGVYSKDIILDVIRQIGTDGARYMAMEFVGDTLKELSMEARMTITNMAIEAGGKSGIMAVDDTVREYLKGRVKNTAPWNEYTSDADAKYIREISVDCAKLEPMVALPHLPSNGKPIGEVLGMEMDQAYIGSCTNGRIEDLRIAAGIIKGKKVKIRTIVVPATPDIWAQAMKEGLFEIFYEANCVVSAPTCGAC
ncbi:MAG: 3-isopropylmalate dehydratase large subunit, partial [Sedimentisphaerales bacterium]|nr:3-isopropylmalate dehydratase large subunit [Sedimentisphaerales bacterium]